MKKLTWVGLSLVVLAPMSCLLPTTTCEDLGSVTQEDGSCRAPVRLADCGARQNPKDDDCAAAKGVFVDAAASNGGDGSRERPLSSLVTALARGGKVYVCNGEYVGAATVTKPVQVVGGLSCDTWGFDESAVTLLTAAANEVPLSITDVRGEVEFSDVRIEARDASAVLEGSTSGRASVAVVVRDSESVTWERSLIVAGRGAPAALHEARVTPPGAAGNMAPPRGNAEEMLCTCADGSESTGGAGGSPPAAAGPTAGGNGTASAATVADDPRYGGYGGFQPENPSRAGQNGRNGVPGPEIEAITSIGQGGELGWVGAIGHAGSAGTPGQGGGGSAGSDTQGGNSGGGGGCGGCGGSGGAGGGAGGSSVAIVSLNAQVTLINTRVQTADAADGGKGGPGDTGGAGGAGGGGDGALSLFGGRGGNGAGGGGGGGGAGGLSIGILYRGAAPVVGGEALVGQETASWATLGRGGAAGAGGPGGGGGVDTVLERTGLGGEEGPPGVGGVAAAVWNLTTN